MNTPIASPSQPDRIGPPMTPETALRMRVLLEALCAALTGMFPWSKRLKAAFASAFAWLDQMAIAAVPVVVDVVADAVGPVVRVRNWSAPTSSCGTRLSPSKRT